MNIRWLVASALLISLLSSLGKPGTGFAAGENSEVSATPPIINQVEGSYYLEKVNKTSPTKRAFSRFSAWIREHQIAAHCLSMFGASIATLCMQRAAGWCFTSEYKENLRVRNLDGQARESNEAAYFHSLKTFLSHVGKHKEFWTEQQGKIETAIEILERKRAEGVDIIPDDWLVSKLISQISGLENGPISYFPNALENLDLTQ